MEDTLRGVLDSLKEGFDKVLILVLMEDTLRALLVIHERSSIH